MLLRYDTSARALTHVDLYKLPRVSFDAIIVQYPRPSRHLVTTAHQVMPADFAGEFDHKVTQLLEDPDMLEEVESPSWPFVESLVPSDFSHVAVAAPASSDLPAADFPVIDMTGESDASEVEPEAVRFYMIHKDIVEVQTRVDDMKTVASSWLLSIKDSKFMGRLRNNHEDWCNSAAMCSSTLDGATETIGPDMGHLDSWLENAHNTEMEITKIWKLHKDHMTCMKY